MTSRKPTKATREPEPELVVLVNLTGGPVELQLPTGPVLLPARGSSAVPAGVADDPLVLRLMAHGAIGRAQS